MSSTAHPQPWADDPPWPDDGIEVGRILGAWGIKGALKVKPFAADPQALFSSKRWFIAPDDSAVAATRLPPRLLRIVSAREQGEAVVAVVQDVQDRDSAQALAGARVFISRLSFPTPADDEVYWVDLIGMSVVNREGVALGEVVGLIETGPHCVLRLKPAGIDAAERLVPYVKAYVDHLDMAGRLITVDWQPDY